MYDQNEKFYNGSPEAKKFWTAMKSMAKKTTLPYDDMVALALKGVNLTNNL